MKKCVTRKSVSQKVFGMYSFEVEQKRNVMAHGNARVEK